jgi:galactokinase
VLAGDVPIGAGLSSSAAIEMAAARAFAGVSGMAWTRGRASSRAGPRTSGCRYGSWIRSSWHGARGPRDAHRLRSLELRPAPPSGNHRRRPRHGHAARAERRVQRAPGGVEEAARALGRAALRDVTAAEMQARGPPSPGRRPAAGPPRRERERPHARGGGGDGGGRRRAQAGSWPSHASLRDDFEVSSPALDAMVRARARWPGATGAHDRGRLQGLRRRARRRGRAAFLEAVAAASGPHEPRARPLPSRPQAGVALTRSALAPPSHHLASTRTRADLAPPVTRSRGAGPPPGAGARSTERPGRCQRLARSRPPRSRVPRTRPCREARPRRGCRRWPP